MASSLEPQRGVGRGYTQLIGYIALIPPGPPGRLMEYGGNVHDVLSYWTILLYRESHQNSLLIYPAPVVTHWALLDNITPLEVEQALEGVKDCAGPHGCT